MNIRLRGVRGFVAGVLVASVIGAGGLAVVRATSGSSLASSFVPVTPVRVVDTRSDLGLVSLVEGVEQRVTVVGSLVPLGATAVSLTVTAVDDASVLVADTQTVNEDNPATGNVLTNDSDVDNTLTVASFQVAGDGATYTAGNTATITGVGTIVLNSDGSYTFTPVANYNGSVPVVTYTTNTGSSETLTLTVRVRVRKGDGEGGGEGGWTLRCFPHRSGGEW